MSVPEYTKHIDNYNFIKHIVSIKCIRCGEFFEPDKTKDIGSVCVECKNKQEIPELKKRGYVRKNPTLTPEQRIERRRERQREYMRNYYKKMKTKPITKIYRSKFKS